MSLFADKYDILKNALCTAALDLLMQKADYIDKLERFGRGGIAVTGIALDVIPWDDTRPIGLSLRPYSEYHRSGEMGDHIEWRYRSANWSHYFFTDGCSSPALTIAASLVSDIYKDRNRSDDAVHLANLIFLAAAEALLDSSVCDLLNELGIRARPATRLSNGSFEYIVTDPDSSISANYCDVVKINRSLKLLLQ